MAAKRRTLTQKFKNISKESFEVEREDDPVMPKIRYPDGVLPGFKDACLDFFLGGCFRSRTKWDIYKHVCYNTESQMLKALALGFTLSEDYFLSVHTNLNQIINLQLLHYPRYDDGYHSNYSVIHGRHDFMDLISIPASVLEKRESLQNSKPC